MRIQGRIENTVYTSKHTQKIVALCWIFSRLSLSRLWAPADRFATFMISKIHIHDGSNWVSKWPTQLFTLGLLGAPKNFCSRHFLIAAFLSHVFEIWYIQYGCLNLIHSYQVCWSRREVPQPGAEGQIPHKNYGKDPLWISRTKCWPPLISTKKIYVY